MDAFEAVVASILQRQGFWTLSSVKVELSREEKREIGRFSAPRWELDIVAYRGRDNELRVIECKSFLDSPGVDPAVFAGANARGESRYKLFCDETLRHVVLARLKRQMVSAGFCRANPKMKLCLAAGKIQKRGGGEVWLQQYFAEQGWLLLGPPEIRNELEGLRDSGYENSVAAIVAKLLLRGSDTPGSHPGVDAEV